MKTKKSTLAILFCGFLMLATSCGSKNDPSAQSLPDPIQKEIITQIFGAGGAVGGPSFVKPFKTIAYQPVFKSPASPSTSVPLTTTTTNGPNGGTVTVSGSVDAVTDATGNGGTMSMTMSEVFSSFGIIAEAKTYTMSGNIQYNANMVVAGTSSTIKMTGKITISGSLTVVGTGYNKQMAVNLTETLNISSSQTASSGTVTVTGTIGGQSINYTVTQ